jgi:hypothetical protein
MSRVRHFSTPPQDSHRQTRSLPEGGSRSDANKVRQHGADRAHPRAIRPVVAAASHRSRRHHDPRRPRPPQARRPAALPARSTPPLPARRPAPCRRRLAAGTVLGVGGFGEVWKARNPHLASAAPVALKFCLDPSAAAVLRNEAAVLDRVMRQGRHPGIVQLHNAGPGFHCYERVPSRGEWCASLSGACPQEVSFTGFLHRPGRRCGPLPRPGRPAAWGR